MIEKTNNMNNIYEKPLLIEVVFEAKFPLKLNMEKRIGDLQDLIKNKFPYVNPENVPRLVFQDLKEPKILEHERIWRFSNDNQEMISVFQGKLTVTQKNYHSWIKHSDSDGFRNLILWAIKKFNEIWETPNFTRIGLRYINKYHFKKEQYTSENFKSIFNPLFDIEKYPIETLTENVMRLRKTLTDDRYLTIQSVFEIKDKEQDEKEISYFLDFDSYKNKIPFENLEKELEKLHSNIIEEFESIITHKLRKEMKLIE